MSVVVVSSTDEDNAAAVFETLNDRGIGLSTPDLLRNLLMRRAANDDVRQRIVAAWQIVLGIADEANVDDFLRHFWVSRYGDVKARKLYREIKDTVLTENLDPLQLSLDLADAAPIYRDIARGQDADPAVRKQLEAMKALGAKVLYPAMLSAYSARGDDIGALREFSSALVTTFVRYNVIGGRESTLLESTIYEAAAHLRSSGDFAAAVDALRALAPDGSEFISRFKRASVSRIATARYLLLEIEHAKRATGEMSVEAPDKVHVEHIYPQTPSDAKWANHAQIINRLGNLTLLGKRFNTSIKNAGFAQKKVDAYESSDIIMTSELLGYETWGPAEIDARQEELSRWVFDVWSFPGEPRPESTEVEADEVAQLANLSDDAQYLDELPDVPE